MGNNMPVQKAGILTINCRKNFFLERNLCFWERNLGCQQRNLGFQKRNLGCQERNLGFQKRNLGCQKRHLDFQEHNLGLQKRHQCFKERNLGFESVVINFGSLGEYFQILMLRSLFLTVWERISVPKFRIAGAIFTFYTYAK